LSIKIHNTILTRKLQFIVFVVIASCSQETNSEYKYYPNGTIEVETKHLNDSTELYISYYSDGSPKDSMALVNGNLTGRVKRYYPNGNCREDCDWRNDLKDGPCLTFFSSGNLESFAEFEDSIPVGNVIEYYDLPVKRPKYVGNYSNVKGKKWVNYSTWYDSTGQVTKATFGIEKIIGNKIVYLGDSLKLSFEVKNLEYPLLRIILADFDKEFSLSKESKIKIFESKKTKIIVFLKAKKLGKNTARGYIENYKLDGEPTDTTYRTFGKTIFWNYDYEVKTK